MRRLVAAVGVALLLAGCTGGDGVRGRLFSIDDTGLADTALDDGWVLAVPGATDTTELWPDADGDVHHLDRRLDTEAVERLDGVLVPVRAGGRFDLDLPAGNALLCRVTGSADRPQAQGCAVVDLPDVGRIDATVGDAGFRVRVRD